MNQHRISGNKIDIYVDGCRKKSGEGGWSFLIIGHDFIKLVGGYELETSNNIMELYGPLKALSLLSHLKNKKMITSDSKYFVDGFNQWVKAWVRRGWRKKNGDVIKNKLLWQNIWDLKCREVNARWVKAHNNHKENEICDLIANICCANKVEIDESFKTIKELDNYVNAFKVT